MTSGVSSSAHPGFVSRGVSVDYPVMHGTVFMSSACTLPTPSSGREAGSGEATLPFCCLTCHATVLSTLGRFWSFQTWACLILSDLHWLQCQAWFISCCCQTLQFPWKASWMMLILMSWAGWFWMCLSVSLAACHGHVSSANLGHWMSLIHVRLNY